MFLAIISLNKLSAPFSVSACLGTLVIHKLVLRMVSYRSHRLSSTHFILFTLFSFDLIFSKFLSSVSLFFFLIDEVHCQMLCVVFSCRSLILWLQNLWLILMDSLLLNLFYLCIVFLILLNCLCFLVAHCLLKTALLNYLSSALES